MPTQTFPADSAALFAAVHKEYEALKELYKKQQQIKDAIIDLSLVVPYPLEKGRILQQQLSLLNREINSCEDKANDLNQVAMLNLLKSTDVVNATKALTCSIGKVKLALDSLTQFENFLAVARSFVTFAGKLSAAAAAAPVGFIAIASLIKELDDIINMELAETLSPEELKKIEKDIRKDCRKST